jgi:hypothetical protein
LYQNSKVLNKLDTIISAQKKLEDRVTKIETILNKSDNDNTELDKTILMVILRKFTICKFSQLCTNV